MQLLAGKFPAVKFIKSISTTCVPNYPDKNLPTLFIYHENVLRSQIIGPLSFNGMNFKLEDLEWRLHRLGVLKSTLNRNENSDFEKSDRLSNRNGEDEMIKTIREGIFSGSASRKQASRSDDEDDDEY